MNRILSFLPTLFALSLSLPCLIAHAGAAGMSEAQMEQMMKNAETAQLCMEKIDTSQLEALEAEGNKIQSKIKGLCKAGKKDEAMHAALDYSMKIKKDPVLKEMMQCGEMMQGMMPTPYSPIKQGANGKPSHVCDTL